MSFYNRLKNRGWDRRTLKTAFVSAHKKMTSPPGKEERARDENSNRETVILHFEYTRHDIQRKKVQEIWNETCGLLEESISEGGLGIKRVICAYSRPRNLRDLLQRAQLHQHPDQKASTYFRGQSFLITNHWPLFIYSTNQTAGKCDQTLQYHTNPI